MNGTYFVSGIDTNIGKTIAVGALARKLSNNGVKVITQKLIQTGNTGFSEDIEMHRRIMDSPLLEEDKQMLTAPCVMSYPCSPHMAAAIDNVEIDLDHIQVTTFQLESLYDVVLLEGAGGLMVPITEDYLTIDYIHDRNYPLIFVTCGRLGSLNHTLLNLEIIRRRDILLDKVVFNMYPEEDQKITQETIRFIKKYLKKHFPETGFYLLEKVDL